MLERAGLNPYMLEMANLREQCSWVHMNEPEAATGKASDLVRMAVARAALLEPLSSRKDSNQQTDFGNRGRHRWNSGGARPCR